MELSGLLSNPRVALELDRIVEALTYSGPSQRSKCRENRPSRPPQGQVLRAIKLILVPHAEGLQTHEVRRLVEAHLGRQLPKSTVKDALANNPAFERIAYGRYRLKH